MSTVLGRSLAKIWKLCNHDGSIYNLCGNIVKKQVKYMQIPDDEVWRIGVIKDMKEILNDDERNGVISFRGMRPLQFLILHTILNLIQ